MKEATGRSIMGGSLSVGSSTPNARSFFNLEYLLTETENNKCKMYTVASRLNPSMVRRSSSGAGSTQEARYPRKVWSPHTDLSYEESAPTSSLLVRNQSDKSHARSPGSRTVPSTFPTNQGDQGGSGAPMASMWDGRWAFVGRRRHRLPRFL